MNDKVGKNFMVLMNPCVKRFLNEFTSKLFILNSDVSSLTMHTENVFSILQDAKRITLNCTYEEDSKETIIMNIRWKKQFKDVFKDIAFFSPPGGLAPFITGDMQPLYSNRTELIAPNTSLSAVMIIKDPVCSDEGIYQCSIEYISKSSITKKNSLSIVGFSGKYVILVYFSF